MLTDRNLSVAITYTKLNIMSRSGGGEGLGLIVTNWYGMTTPFNQKKQLQGVSKKVMYGKQKFTAILT